MKPDFLRPGSRAGSTLSAHIAAWRADAFVETYVCWREASEAVGTAYDRWRGGQRPDRRLAFAAYRAALDREEHAALIFRERAELVQSAEASGRS
jgi:hypothetical protein